MNNKPLVSIIIPCYNNGKELIEAIDSIKNQTFRNTEIIIVNDGSDDETIKILNLIQDENRDIIIINQNNQGPSCAKNKGILNAKGDLILPLDCDNKLYPDFIEKTVTALQKNDVQIVYTNFRFFGGKNENYRSIKFSCYKLLMVNFIENTSLYKKEVWEANGGYDVFLSKIGLEDWEFWINSAEHNFSFFHLDEILFDYMVSENSRTNQFANKNLKEIKSHIYKKHSDLLAKEFEFLYHENKNFKSMLDYRIGNFLLKPVRWFKELSFNLKISKRLM